MKKEDTFETRVATGSLRVNAFALAKDAVLAATANMLVDT